MPKYISRRFVNGQWQYEYENTNRPLSRRKKVAPGVGIKVAKRGVTGQRVGSGSAAKRLRAKSPNGVERKRVMSSHNRINSFVNDIRKGYGSEASAAKKHERSVRESARSAYRRDVSDSRGSGGSTRRMTQRENMRSLSKWRKKVSSENGAKLRKQGASTDSGHRTSGIYSTRARRVSKATRDERNRNTSRELPTIVNASRLASAPARKKRLDRQWYTSVRRKDGQFRRSNRNR